MLCSDVLVELEKKKPKHDGDEKKPDCSTVVDEYHGFIGATVKFLRDVREKQGLWRWDSQSKVFEGVGWLQALWASRGAVSCSFRYSYAEKRSEKANESRISEIVALLSR